VVAGVLVAVVHLASDIWAGQPLRTPILLDGLLFESGGAPAAHPGALSMLPLLRFSALHFLAWLVLGGLAAWLVSFVDAHPRRGLLVFGGASFVFLSLLQAGGAFSLPELPKLQVWMATLAGAAALSAPLARRHPDLLQSLEDSQLTPTARRDLLAALDAERASLALYDQAEGLAPEHPDLRALAEATEGRVRSLLQLCERFSVSPDPQTSARPGPSLTRLAQMWPLAIEAEERKMEMYDQFLVSIGERALHTVFLELAAGSEDRIVPRLRRCLEGDHEVGEGVSPPSQEER